MFHDQLSIYMHRYVYMYIYIDMHICIYTSQDLNSTYMYMHTTGPKLIYVYIYRRFLHRGDDVTAAVTEITKDTTIDSLIRHGALCVQVWGGCQKVSCILLHAIVCIFSHPTYPRSSGMAHCVCGCEEGVRKSNVFYCMMSCVCSHILHAFTHPAWRAVRAGMRRVSESLIYSTAWCRVYILTPVTPCECRNFCGARRGISQPTLCRRMITVCNSTCRQVNLRALFRMHRPLLWNHMALLADT